MDEENGAVESLPEIVRCPACHQPAKIGQMRCGVNAIIDNYMWVVACPQCLMRGPSHTVKKLAIELWNSVASASLMASLRSGFVYVGSPYTHDDPQVRKERFLAAARYVGHLVEKGVTALSPIVHYHIICKAYDLDKANDTEFWRKINFDILSRADSLHILKLDGWRESSGLRDEGRFAKKCGIKVVFVDPEEVGI